MPDRFPGIFELADIASFGECSRTLPAPSLRGRYTPPSLQGTLAYPVNHGRRRMGRRRGRSAQRRSMSSTAPTCAQIYKLISNARNYEAEAKTGRTGRIFPADTASPYGFYLHNFLNFLGMPCWNPPYGTLSAYDLNTGKLLWKKPFGQVQKWGFYMPKSWGSVTIGAPLITKSGLIFIGASMDARVRAIDLKSGDVSVAGAGRSSRRGQPRRLTSTRASNMSCSSRVATRSSSRRCPIRWRPLR